MSIYGPAASDKEVLNLEPSDNFGMLVGLFRHLSLLKSPYLPLSFPWNMRSKRPRSLGRNLFPYLIYRSGGGIAIKLNPLN